MNELTKLFGDEILNRYTDQQAIEDGVLIDISHFQLTYDRQPINRITTTLWEEFQPFLRINLSLTLEEAFQHMIRTKLQHIKNRSEYTGEIGDIVVVPPNLWLVRNEVKGFTLMFPTDY